MVTYGVVTSQGAQIGIDLETKNQFVYVDLHVPLFENKHDSFPDGLDIFNNKITNVEKATIISPPGLQVDYPKNTRVLVAFRENSFERPVVLGKLYTPDTANAWQDALDALNVTLDAKFTDIEQINSTINQNLTELQKKIKQAQDTANNAYNKRSTTYAVKNIDCNTLTVNKTCSIPPDTKISFSDEELQSVLEPKLFNTTKSVIKKVDPIDHFVYNKNTDQLSDAEKKNASKTQIKLSTIKNLCYVLKDMENRIQLLESTNKKQEDTIQKLNKEIQTLKTEVNKLKK